MRVDKADELEKEAKPYFGQTFETLVFDANQRKNVTVTHKFIGVGRVEEKEGEGPTVVRLSAKIEDHNGRIVLGNLEAILNHFRKK